MVRERFGVGNGVRLVRSPGPIEHFARACLSTNASTMIANILS